MIILPDEIKSEITALTRELIRIPSLTGQEGKLAGTVLEKLKKSGIEDSFIDEAGNVVGILYGENRGPNILLNGHLDVVPPGNTEDWHGYDPFGGEVDDSGYIHGRGASDLKGGLSVILILMKLLSKAQGRGIHFPGNLIFSAVVHEEAAEMLGMEHLCRITLPKKGISFDLVFLYEATDLNIYLGHRGKVELALETEGKMAHSSSPWLGVNALELMLPVLNRIFGRMSSNLSFHQDLGKSSITVTNLKCKPGTLSIIPDKCEISIDRRYLPGENLEDLIREFEQVFKEIKKEDPRFRASIHPRKILERSYTGYQKEVKKFHPPWITGRENKYVKTVMRALKKAGQNPDYGYWKGGTDGSMTGSLMNIPTIGYSGMEEQYAHTNEDMVNIDKMIKSLEGYIHIICELFNLKPENILL